MFMTNISSIFSDSFSQHSVVSAEPFMPNIFIGSEAEEHSYPGRIYEPLKFSDAKGAFQIILM